MLMYLSVRYGEFVFCLVHQGPCHRALRPHCEEKTELHSFSIGLEILSIALGFGLATLRNKLVHGKRVPIRLAIGVGAALPPLCQIAP